MKAFLNRFKKELPPANVLVGKKIVFGIPPETKPVRGIDPKARAKIVFRPNNPAELVMLTDSRDSSFVLEDRGEYWIVDQEVRREVIVK